MTDWYTWIARKTQLPSAAADALLTQGFTVISGPVPAARMPELIRSYDEATSAAITGDVKIGSTTTRVRDFVNRGAEFDEIYVHSPLLQACCQVIQQAFKLSTMHARTLRPNMPAQGLHLDFARDPQGWPMIGFILMIDDFTPENGATCFVSGSQGSLTLPTSRSLIPACGPAGSLIVFNGSVWHGHGPNVTDKPRRSIQGAFIRRTEISGETLPARMQPETLRRISPLARYLLAAESAASGT